MRMVLSSASADDGADAVVDDASADVGAGTVPDDDAQAEVADEPVSAKPPISSKRVTAKSSKQGPSGSVRSSV